jgi:hypothetical protein
MLGVVMTAPLAERETLDVGGDAERETLAVMQNARRLPPGQL